MGGTGQRFGSRQLEIVYEYMDPNQGAFVIMSEFKSGTSDRTLPSGARTGTQSVFTDSGMVLTLGGVGAAGDLPTDLLLFNPF